MIKLFKPKRRYNKIIIVGLVLIASVVVSGWALGYGQNNNRDGLVIDIDFSEANYNSGTRTFADQSGNGNHAVSTNAAAFAPDKDGKSTGAMRLNGSSDFAAIANPSTNFASTITVSYWMNLSAYASGYASHAISKATISATNDATFVDYVFGGSHYDAGKMLFSANRGGSWGVVSPHSPVLALHTWHFVTWTYNKDVGGRLYINGAEVPGGPVGSGVLGTNSQPIRLGHHYFGGHSYFNGAITGVKIFDRVLSSLEISKLYTASKPKLTFSSLEKGLVGHWPLNEETYNSTTGRATDVSAYSRHGINGGSDLTADRLGKANSAMQFDGGSNDIIDIADTPKLPKFSLSAWVYNESGGDSRHSLIRDYWEIVGTQICYFSYDFINQYWRCSANDALPVNTWTQVVTTWDGSVIRHYTNGNLIWTDPLTSSGTSQAFTAIGGYASRKLKARVSDVKIYDRALTSDEIKRAYDHNNPELSSSSLSKGLVLDMPLMSAYVKGGAAGAEVVTDVTPYSNDGENYGANISADSAQFDGVNDYIISENNIGSAGSSSRTVSVWFYPEAQRAQNLLGYGSQATGKLFDIYLGANRQVGGHFYSSGYDTLGADSPLYTLNQWQHFVISYDGANTFIYFNGVFYKQKSLSLDTGISKLVIGKGGWVSLANFQGKISNVKIFNRALTATEVKTLFDQGRGASGVMMNQ